MPSPPSRMSAPPPPFSVSSPPPPVSQSLPPPPLRVSADGVPGIGFHGKNIVTEPTSIPFARAMVMLLLHSGRPSRAGASHQGGRNNAAEHPAACRPPRLSDGRAGGSAACYLRNR